MVNDEHSKEQASQPFTFTSSLSASILPADVQVNVVNDENRKEQASQPFTFNSSLSASILPADVK